VRATRAAEGLPELPHSQVILLRKLMAKGPLTPADLSGELHLARSTVSNLITDLATAGLVNRETSPTDRRSVLVTPTDRAREILSTFHVGTADVLDTAFGELYAAHRDEITDSLDGLDRLLDVLESMSDATTPTDGKQ
jgi:DNA-binding MarR family transcriptional regulator